MTKRKRSKVIDKSPVEDQPEEGLRDRKKVRWEGQSRDTETEDSEVDSESEESAGLQKAYLCINASFEAS